MARDTEVNLIIRGRDLLSRVVERARTSTSRFFNTIKEARFGLLAIGAAFAVATRAVQSWVSAALVQERAEAKLAQTLSTLTGATNDQIEALKAQASALQQATGYGDELIISAQAQLGTFRLTADQIELLTPRLLDMAEAARRAGKDNADLESIALQVGKAFTSGIGSLTRYGVALTEAQREAFKLADQSGKTAILVQALDQNFAGLAETVGDTFEGSVRKASAAQGDFLEVLGSLFTQSEGVQRLVDTFRQAFASAGEGIASSGDTIRNVIDVVANTVTFFVNTVRSAFNAVQIAFKGLTAVIVEGVRLIALGLSKITFGDLSKQLRQFSDDMSGTLEKIKESIEQDATDIEQASRGMAASLGLVDDQAKQTERSTARMGDAVADAGGEFEASRPAVDTYADALKRLQVDVEEVRTGVGREARQIISAFQEIATNAESSGDVVVAAFTKAVALAPDLRTVTALGESFAQALEEGQIEAEQYAAGLNAIIPAVAELRREAAGLDQVPVVFGATADASREAAQGVREVKEETEAAQAAAQENGATWTALLNLVEGVAQAVGRQAEETSKGIVSAEAVRDAFRETLAIINDQQPIGNFNQFMLNLVRAGEGVERSWRNQADAYRTLITQIQNGTVDLERSIFDVEALRDTFDLLDQTTLDGLIGEVERARDSIAGLIDSTEESIRRLQDRIDRLSGNDAAALNRQFLDDLERIDEQIRTTRDAELRRRLQDERRLLEELHELELAQIEERKRKREESGETTTSRTGGGGGGGISAPQTAPPAREPSQEITFNFTTPVFNEEVIRRDVVPILDRIGRLRQ